MAVDAVEEEVDAVVAVVAVEEEVDAVVAVVAVVAVEEEVDAAEEDEAAVVAKSPQPKPINTQTQYAADAGPPLYRAGYFLPFHR